MEKEAILHSLMHNSNVYPTSEVDPLEAIKGPSIYEVIRIIDGIPLYLEEHLARLRKSGEIINVHVNTSDEEIVNDIYKLINENNERNLNVKILCGNFNGNEEDLYIYFIKSFYPSEDIYREGIHVILYESERQNPNAKTPNRELRNAVNKKREEFNAFEALLVNHKGYITEGSRSNAFFVKNNLIYTSTSENVLLGVTRAKILELCNSNDIEVIEEDISVNTLESFEGAFITGTSINVLPINTIDKISLNSGNVPIIKRLIEIYEGDVMNYINSKNRG